MFHKKAYNASTMRNLTTTAVLALIAGCAQLEWMRADTAAATRSEDLARCEQQARSSASEYTPIPNVSVGPGGSVSVQTPLPHALGNAAWKSDLLGSCMQAKGYRLAPAK